MIMIIVIRINKKVESQQTLKEDKEISDYDS